MCPAIDFAFLLYSSTFYSGIQIGGGEWRIVFEYQLAADSPDELDLWYSTLSLALTYWREYEHVGSDVKKQLSVTGLNIRHNIKQAVGLGGETRRRGSSNASPRRHSGTSGTSDAGSTADMEGAGVSPRRRNSSGVSGTGSPADGVSLHRSDPNYAKTKKRRSSSGRSSGDWGGMLGLGKSPAKDEDPSEGEGASGWKAHSGRVGGKDGYQFGDALLRPAASTLKAAFGGSQGDKKEDKRGGKKEEAAPEE
jgi:hypothetical protein